MTPTFSDNDTISYQTRQDLYNVAENAIIQYNNQNKPGTNFIVGVGCKLGAVGGDQITKFQRGVGGT